MVYGISKANKMLEQYEMDASHCCTQCSYQTIWKFQLDRHVRRKHGNKAIKLFIADTEPESYSCVFCSFQSQFKLAHFGHWNQHGEATDTNTYQSCHEFTKYLCNKCHHSWHAMIHLAQHSCKTMRKVATSSVVFTSSTKSFQCTECPYKASVKSRLNRHFLVQHVPDEEATWFNCTHCSYRSKYKKYNLTRHMALYHVADDRIPWLNCAKCSYRTRAKRSLNNHMVLHARPEDIEWLTCAQCSYRAKLKMYLVRHMRKHDRANTDKKPYYNCAKCSFRTKIKRSLTRHMLNHAEPYEIEWFSCGKCSYRAKAKATLKRHMLTHNASENDWFNCTECHYRTIRKGCLKTHMQQQHGDADAIKWWSCADCSYRAKQSSSLKYHREKHHSAGEQTRTSFVCSICSFRTVHKISLKRHLMSQHKDAAKVE